MKLCCPLKSICLFILFSHDNEEMLFIYFFYAYLKKNKKKRNCQRRSFFFCQCSFNLWLDTCMHTERQMPNHKETQSIHTPTEMEFLFISLQGQTEKTKYLQEISLPPKTVLKMISVTLPAAILFYCVLLCVIPC